MTRKPRVRQGRRAPAPAPGVIAAPTASPLGAFAPIRSQRLYEQIAMHIEHAIFDRRLRSGDKLPAERELATQFAASRVAVREALRMLQLRGLLHVRKGPTGGYFVRDANADVLTRDLRTLAVLGRFSASELTEVRLSIEPEVARLAALRATPVDHAALAAVLDKRSHATEAQRPPSEFDLEFHRLLAVATKNAVYPLLFESLMQLEADFVVPRYSLGNDDHASVGDAHREIYDAIVAGDGTRAHEAMRRHVVDLRVRLLRAPVVPPGR